MLPLFKKAGFILLFLSSTLADTIPQNQPRLRSNGTLNLAQSGSSPNTRDFDLVDRYYYYDCPTGYSECSTDTSKCCATGNRCCDSGYCADPGDTCCTIGTCPSGWDCCGNYGYCSPVGGECCEGGYYCDVGYQCKIWDGEDVCCPASGCVGSDGTGSLGNTVGAGSATETATSAASGTSTYESTTEAGYTYTSDSYEYDYYYTTYYWSYWFYFWTSYSPYTVQTVTSTETTTTTIWSAYATDSADARESFSYSVDLHSFYTPYTATYLESSTDPVPIATGAAGTPTATGIDVRVGGAPSTVIVRAWVPWVYATFGLLMGALAFGL
ncbi:hypothetical protein N7507_006103 [Penicillium longicatenatum]|nr:hypothetical protein N7507_006103 [Penicillium longicatenatum]